MPSYEMTVELQGHLIDSLTLAKVIDLIQEFGGDYELNHLWIGHRKNELSLVNLTILAPSQKKLEEILVQVRPYGAHPVVNLEVNLEPCLRDGHVPPQAVIPLTLPRELRFAGQTIPVEGDSFQWAVVFDPNTKTANLKRVADIKKGDQVVMGSQGLDWTQVRGGTEGGRA